MKKCSACGEVLDTSLFYKDRGNSSGFRSACKMCMDERKRTRYQKDLEESRARQRKYSLRWRLAHPERFKVVNFNAHHRRRSNMAVDEGYRIDFKKILIGTYGEICMNPDCKSTDRIEVDHIVPVSRGGKHLLSNLQLLCKSCNSSKGSKNQIDYRMLVQ